MKIRILTIVVSVALVLLISPVGMAEIIVTSGNFIGDEYVFEIDPTSYSTFGNSHDAALIADHGVLNYGVFLPTLFQGFTTNYGPPSPYFTYRWDFSSSPKPKQVTITDRITLFSEYRPGFEYQMERALATISFSLNGTDFTTIRQLATPTDGSVVGDSIETYTLPLGSGVSEFFYRVQVEVTAGDDNNRIDSYTSQWARSYEGTSVSPFIATFSAVPEPSSSALFVVGLLCLVGCRYWRRH